MQYFLRYASASLTHNRPYVSSASEFRSGLSRCSYPALVYWRGRLNGGPFFIEKVIEKRVLIPGVLESKSNFIEHPELIAQRIGRYAKLVGRENVIAGSDCGYGTWVGQAAVDPQVVFAKLAAMAEGAAIASKQFWK